VPMSKRKFLHTTSKKKHIENQERIYRTTICRASL
jgi:hypothetical protein